MEKDMWSLCQTSPKHRMLFDEQAGNFNFGMIKRKTKSTPTFHEARIAELKTHREGKPMAAPPDTNSAIRELQESGVTLTDLDRVEEKGLGDTIERILTKFGITKSLMSEIAGRTCGCNNRKTWLNKLLPYSKD